MMKQGVIVVSYGTVNEQARRGTLDAVVEEVGEMLPQATIRYAYTSDLVRRRLAEAGEKVYSVAEALEAMLDEKIEEVVVLVTHLVKGTEYEKLEAIVEIYKERFGELYLSTPLLSEEACRLQVLHHLVNKYLEEEDLLVLVGHGTKAAGNTIYQVMAKECEQVGYHQVRIFIMDELSSLKEELVQIEKVRRVKIIPLMVVAGNHVKCDFIAIKNILQGELSHKGVEVEVITVGLADEEVLRKLYYNQLLRLIQRANEEIHT